MWSWSWHLVLILVLKHLVLVLTLVVLGDMVLLTSLVGSYPEQVRPHLVSDLVNDSPTKLSTDPRKV